jgi:tetratricopeptide (TPR) repeat protein
VNATLRRHAAAIAAITAAVAALYGRTLRYDFVHYDDQELLVAHYGDLVEASLPSVFWRDSFAVLGPEAHGVYYRPLLVADYQIEARIAGPSPAAFHASSLLLHAIASGCVYALLVAFGVAPLLATGLALIFACHPASALIAAWVPCRNESMLAIACIASTLALLRFLREGRGAALALSVAAFAAALFTKESGGALIAVLACVVALERTGRPGEADGLARARYALLGSIAIWAGLRQLALGHSPTGIGAAFANWTAPIVYLGKAIFPIQLAVVPHPSDTSLVPGIAALGLLAVAIVSARDRLRGPAGLGLVWCAAFLAPAVLVPQQSWGLEHRIYLPLIGLLLFASQLSFPKWIEAPAWVPRALPFAVALVFALITAHRLPDFAAPIPYWESALRTAPHSVAAASRVAWRYFEAGQFGAVPDAATRALALEPNRAEMLLVRGIAYARHGDFARAEPDLVRVTDLEPDNGDAWENLARLQKLTGQLERSRESQRRVDEISARPKRETP